MLNNENISHDIRVISSTYQTEGVDGDYNYSLNNAHRIFIQVNSSEDFHVEKVVKKILNFYFLETTQHIDFKAYLLPYSLFNDTNYNLYTSLNNPTNLIDRKYYPGTFNVQEDKKIYYDLDLTNVTNDTYTIGIKFDMLSNTNFKFHKFVTDMFIIMKS